MQMSGERTIAADRARVWAALNDPDVLKACIPGCEEMQKTSPTEFEAKVTQKVGPVKATFNGQVELTDVVEGHSYRISGKGKGGAAGGASGGATVRLEEVPEGTRLAYDVDAKVTGKLAQLGGRLIDGFAKKFADDFFDRFKAQVEGPGGAGDSGAATSAASNADAPAASGAGGASGGAQMQSDRQRMTETPPDAASAIADAAVTADADDAPAPPPEQAHEVPSPGEARPAATATTTPPVAGRSAGRAHDHAARTTEAKVRSESADPAPQKKSWWARLFG
jgi:carbon monoxide dehydrogenase subunit G